MWYKKFTIGYKSLIFFNLYFVIMSKIQKMSLTRALHEAKHRGKAFAEVWVWLNHKLPTIWGTKRKSDTIYPGVNITPDTAAKNGKAAQASVLDTLTNLVALRCAIVMANSKTDVTINGKTMTVGEAIQHREQLPTLIAMLKNIVAEAGKNRQKAEQKNDTTRATLQQTFTQVANAAAGSGKQNVNPTDIFNQVDTSMLTASVVFEDPSGMEEWAVAELERSEKFLKEIDFALSEVNAKTEIEVTFA